MSEEKPVVAIKEAEQVEKVLAKETVDDSAEIDKEEAQLSAFQLKERRERTVFVGNMPLDTTRKYLDKLFGKHGKVEKVWFRSIALDHLSKVPLKAKIIRG
jgi:RNA recognition motif-containing protein